MPQKPPPAQNIPDRSVWERLGKEPYQCVKVTSTIVDEVLGEVVPIIQRVRGYRIPDDLTVVLEDFSEPGRKERLNERIAEEGNVVGINLQESKYYLDRKLLERVYNTPNKTDTYPGNGKGNATYKNKKIWLPNDKPWELDVLYFVLAHEAAHAGQELTYPEWVQYTRQIKKMHGEKSIIARIFSPTLYVLHSTECLEEGDALVVAEEVLKQIGIKPPKVFEEKDARNEYVKITRILLKDIDVKEAANRLDYLFKHPAEVMSYMNKNFPEGFPKDFSSYVKLELNDWIRSIRRSINS